MNVGKLNEGEQINVFCLATIIGCIFGVLYQTKN